VWMYLYIGIFALLVVLWFLFPRSPSRSQYARKYTDKVVVITGASSGIGKELAKRVSKFGPKLVLSARSDLDDLKKECEVAGAKEVLLVKTDVSVRTDCKHLVDETIKKFGGIDVLFLNAGIGQADRIRNCTPEVLETIIRTNYFGATDIACYALESLRKNQGHIVVTSSVVSRLCNPGTAAYCASKAAVTAFFDCLRLEEYSNGIKVTTLCPGFVPTNVVTNSLTGKGEKFGQQKVYPSKWN